MKALEMADHLLTSTYLVVQDPKLLLGALGHLKRYYMETIPKLLQHHGIQPLSTLRGQQEQLQRVLDDEQVQAVDRVLRLAEEHETSPVEFRKDDRFVIADEQYKLHLLTREQLLKELAIAKNIDASLP